MIPQELIHKMNEPLRFLRYSGATSWSNQQHSKQISSWNRYGFHVSFTLLIEKLCYKYMLCVRLWRSWGYSSCLLFFWRYKRYWWSEKKHRDQEDTGICQHDCSKTKGEANRIQDCKSRSTGSLRQASNQENGRGKHRAKLITQDDDKPSLSWFSLHGKVLPKSPCFMFGITTLNLSNWALSTITTHNIKII